MCILRLSVLCTFMISLPLDPKKPNLFVLASSTPTTATSDSTSTSSTISASTSTASTISASTSTASTTSAEPSTSSTTSDSTSIASTTSDSTSATSTTSDSTSSASTTSDSTSTTYTTSDSTSAASTTSDSTSAASTTSAEPFTSSTTSDSTSTASTTSDSISAASTTSAEPSTSSTTSDITSTASATSDSTSAASTTSAEPSTSSTTSDITSTTSATSDSTSTTSTTSDSTSTASTTSDSTSTASTSSDSTSTASTSSDSTSTTSTTSDSTSTASTTSDTTPTYNSIDTSLSDMHSTSSNTGDDTSTVPNTSDDMSTVPNTSDDTSVGQNTSNNLSSDSITSKATSTVLTNTATATLLTSTAIPTTTTAHTLTQTPVANLPFRMKFNNSLYNDSLKDNNSPYYKQVSDSYKTQLTNAWRNGTPGFEDVVIKSFRLGSLIVDYIVIIKVNKDNMTELLDNLNFTVLPQLAALDGADEDYLKSRFESDIEDAKFQVVDAQKDLCNLNNACPEGWQCKDLLNSLVLCTSPCANKSCNNGICSLDIDKKAKCSCKKDDHYIYGGDDCSEKAEKLTMESETIIAIAAGVGGGLILILLVVLIVTCCRRKSPKDKMGESSQMSMLPMTEIGDDNAALITRDMSLTTDLATSRLYRDTKAAPSNLRDVVPIAEIGSFEDDGRSRSGREMRYGDDGRLYHSIPENQIYGAASAGRGYTNKALEGDNDQAVAYFYQPEKLNRFGMESSDVNRKRQDEMARYSSAPTRDDRSQYISDSAPKREIEPDYFDWSNGAPRSSQEPRFTHTNLDKANAGDPRGHYKSGVDPRTHQQPSSRPYSPDSSAPSYYNDPPQRSNVYDYILAEKPVAIRRPTLMPQKR